MCHLNALLEPYSTEDTTIDSRFGVPFTHAQLGKAVRTEDTQIDSRFGVFNTRPTGPDGTEDALVFLHTRSIGSVGTENAQSVPRFRQRRN